MDDFMKFMLISGNLQRMQEELENEPAVSLLSKKMISMMKMKKILILILML